jgi:GNAT superfamily N-acetyltransferase
VIEVWDGVSDLQRLVQVSEAAGALFAEHDVHLPPDDPAQMLRAANAVLIAGRPPFGFAALDEVDGHAHLAELAVRPSHGRRGVGGQLLGGAWRWARGRGCSALTLTTFRDLPFNGPWYARHGFRELPEGEWGEELRALWRAEAPIRVAPRMAMIRRDRPGQHS